jgi:hypothetical protein
MSIVVRRATTADAELVSALNADVQALHAAALPVAPVTRIIVPLHVPA